MKTVVINPNSSFAKGINNATIEPPIGIAYLSSYLRKKGYECSLIDANILQLSEQGILEKIGSDTGIIGISFNVVSAISAFRLVKYLKSELPSAIFIAGGPHPTCIPEICISEFGFDAVCIGEGEETFLDIVENINSKRSNPFEGVSGVYYREGNKVIKNPPRKLIENLDMIPFADLGLLPDLSLYRSLTRAKPCGIILASRGCPYHCTYCNKNIFHARYRLRSVDNVISEIEYQIQRSGIRQIDFMDDNITVNANYANNLFDEIIRRNFNLFINLQNGVRADLINEDLVRKMKKAGVFKVAIGVESGDASIQKIIKKDLKLDKVLETTRLFKKYGIKVYGNFMLGLPE
ncbi:MAG: B12-binding domain-containing radical SAM protein, partial [Candidatus Omnitrophica bacterium]|nr:B12-binding domain-containing radical SAM protein [Candidatus Omnitrophota bacterium]